MVFKEMSKSLFKLTLNCIKNNKIEQWTISFILIQALLVVCFSHTSLSDINEEILDSESQFSSPTLIDDYFQDQTTLRYEQGLLGPLLKFFQNRK